MTTLEKITKEIDRLAKMWQPNDDGNFPWTPFGDAWTISSGSMEPHERVCEARTPAKPAAIPVPITNRCADALQAIWDGNAAACVGTASFHQYAIAGSPRRFWAMWARHPQSRELHRAGVWACNNLKDAGEKYSWTGTSLEFPLLALALQVAVSQGDQLRAAAVCLNILKWGGVRNRAEKMVAWLCARAHCGALCDDLVDATARLVPQSRASLDCFDGVTYLMNSSSTKLYAAMALDLTGGLEGARQDVLIYDGRVAAGLALITRIIFVTTGATKIPHDLRFPVDRADGDVRDPSIDHYKFPRFAYTAKDHLSRAKFARIGSLYIQEVLGLHVPSAEFALAEKGLFMIGYDVRSTAKAQDQAA